MSMSNHDRSQNRTGRALARMMQRAVMTLHARLYQISGGRIGGQMFNSPVLLLTTTGRKTGKQRVTPLLYLPDGAEMVVVASNGGAAKDPVWWLNLQAQPLAQVQVGRTRLNVHAQQATPEQKPRLWNLLTNMYPSYTSYQQRTTRPIPVIILTPIARNDATTER